MAKGPKDTFILGGSGDDLSFWKKVIIMVVLQSLAGTGHKVIRTRPKLGDKLEEIYFDPLVQKNVLYKELKKIRTFRSSGE